MIVSQPGILSARRRLSLPVWTSHDPNFSGNNAANDIAYGNSVWVCVGEGGELSTSSDAETWTLRTSSFSGTDINGVYYGSDGYWVATGDGGKLATATDPTGTWTQRTSNTSEDIQQVFYNGTHWVAACLGNDKFIYNAGAPTGAWTEDTEAGDWIGCGYGNGLWAMCGTSSDFKTATTPSGTWTTRTSNVVVATDVRYLGGTWMCCGNTSLMSTSSDGITWTNRSVGLGANSSLRGIGYANDMWFVGCLTTGSGNVSWATDPTGTWTAFSPAPANTNLTVNGFATDGTFIVGVAGRAVSPYHEIIKGTFS